MLSYEELHRQLEYTPFTGDFTWKIDKPGVTKGSIAGCTNREGYITIRINGTSYLAHRLAWFYVYGYMPENDLDHKKRVPTDNRIRMIREISPQCSLRNRGTGKNNTSGVKGVCPDKDRWRATITINTKSHYLGVHLDFDEAVCHRLAAEQCLDWSDCDISSPAYLYVQRMLGKLQC